MNEPLEALLDLFDLVEVATALKERVFEEAAIALGDTSVSPVLFSQAGCILREHDFFKRSMVDEELQTWLRTGYRNTFWLAFAFRHKLTLLALSAHLAALARLASGGSGGVERFEASLPEALREEVAQGQPLVHALLGQGARDGDRFAPLIGFSALGAHVCFRRLGQCRALDPFEMAICEKPADDLFCAQHDGHRWWVHPEPSSTLPKMFLFYAHRQNVLKYDEEQLREMVRRFWRRYRVTLRSRQSSPRELAGALSYFQYSDVDAVRLGGQRELRHRYYDRAKALHPDAGGDEGSFVELKDHYEILRAFLFQQKK